MLGSFEEEFANITQLQEAGSVVSLQNTDELSKIKEYSTKNDLVIWGCGVRGNYAIKQFQRMGIPITGICDRDKAGTTCCGYPVMSPEKLVREHPQAYFIVATTRYHAEISAALQDMGISGERILPFPFTDGSLILPMVISQEDFEAKYQEGYQWAYNFFQDEHSRKIVLDRIAMYLHSVPLERSAKSLQYFESSIVRLKDGEVFLDGGGYVGDTVLSFVREMEQSGASWRHIYTFEPEAENLETMQQALAQIRDVDIVPSGLWSEKTELDFLVAQDSSSSCLTTAYGLNVEHKTVKVSVTALDCYFSNLPEEEWPTFIKMDIEGSEKEALIGAKRIIKAKRPKLAICVYHKPEDIYELTELIHRYVPDYSFFLRQCAAGYYETVLYAVPKEDIV